MCVCGGGGGGRDEAISTLKGAGATHALPLSYLHMSCLPWPVLYTKANPDGIFLIFNANSEFRCKCFSKFIRGDPTGPPPPRVSTTEG